MTTVQVKVSEIHHSFFHWWVWRHAQAHHQYRSVVRACGKEGKWSPWGSACWDPVFIFFYSHCRSSFYVKIQVHSRIKVKALVRFKRILRNQNESGTKVPQVALRHTYCRSFQYYWVEEKKTSALMSRVHRKQQRWAGSSCSAGCLQDVFFFDCFLKYAGRRWGAPCLFWIPSETPTLGLFGAVVMIRNTVCCFFHKQSAGDARNLAASS